MSLNYVDPRLPVEHRVAPTWPETTLQLCVTQSYHALDMPDVLSILHNYVNDPQSAARVTTVRLLTTGGALKLSNFWYTTSILTFYDEQTTCIKQAILSSGLPDSHLWNHAIFRTRDLIATLAFLVLLFPHLHSLTIETELFSPPPDKAADPRSSEWFLRAFHHGTHSVNVPHIPAFVSRFPWLRSLKVIKGSRQTRNPTLPPPTFFAALHLPGLRELDLSGLPDFTLPKLGSGTWPWARRIWARNLRVLRIGDATVGHAALNSIMEAVPLLEEFELDTWVRGYVEKAFCEHYLEPFLDAGVPRVSARVWQEDEGVVEEMVKEKEEVQTRPDYCIWNLYEALNNLHNQ